MRSLGRSPRFAHHGELPIPGKSAKLMFLILYDGAINLVTTEVVQDKKEPTTMSLMTEYFEKYQVTLKVVVADQAFVTPHVEAYNNRRNYQTCSNRTWPSMAEQRAEAAARLLKHQQKIMLQTIHEGYELCNGIVMKYGNLVRKKLFYTFTSSEESMTSEGSDHASCMVMFDAALTSSG